MALSDMEHAAGMREFPLRIRHRVIVFDPSKRWWMHCVERTRTNFRALLAVFLRCRKPIEGSAERLG